MNLKQIFESPIFNPLYVKAKWESDDYISKNHIAKNYDFLISIICNGAEVRFFELHNKKQIIGCIKSSMPWDETEIGYLEVFVVDFIPAIIPLPIDLQTNNVIQIKNAITDVRFAGRGLATFVYFNILVDRLNYVVICDDEHFFSGVKLWRKMAKLSMKYNKEILLINNGQYMLDKNNQPIIFNDTNFPKSKIWSTLPNNRGKNVLFVLRNKQ
jgi:hypothetical protein